MFLLQKFEMPATGLMILPIENSLLLEDLLVDATLNLDMEKILSFGMFLAPSMVLSSPILFLEIKLQLSNGECYISWKTINGIKILMS